MKIKTFPFSDPQSDFLINTFLRDHELDVEQNGMYVFEDRVVFVYDEGTIEDKIARVMQELLG